MDGVPGLLCTGLREPYEHVLSIVRNGFLWLDMERWSFKPGIPTRLNRMVSTKPLYNIATT